ncbi:MAG: hypothetical protein M3Q17_10595 [Actinomycetota bacterium]|nr:hypothetical protein [Actinomycetota bacterium]
MAADLIAAVSEIPASEVDVLVAPNLDPVVLAEVEAARKAVAALDEQQRNVAAVSRQAARHLREIGLTGVDAATVLGVSAQRVSQLAKS